MPLAVNDTSGRLIPYEVGGTLKLDIPDGKAIQVTIMRICSNTISPVMEVQLKTPNDHKKAILKLYDRRFGETRERHPYTQQAEDAWRESVRSGLAENVLEDLQSFDDSIRKRRFRDVNDESYEEGEEEECEEAEDEDELKMDEINIFYNTRKLHKKEIRAYAALQSLQGRCVPKFINSVIYSSLDVPTDLPTVYFHIPGVLLEYIDGFPLSDLTLVIPDQPLVWKTIVKSAIDVAREVNRTGVIHHDCQPRNVLVADRGQGTFQPYLIDFAQCAFKADYRDTEDLDDENGYVYNINRVDNHGAIAALMSLRVERDTPYKLDIQELLN